MEPKFETHIFNKEDIQKMQEDSKPFDVFGVDDFDRRIATIKEDKSTYEDLEHDKGMQTIFLEREAALKRDIQYRYDIFLTLDSKVPSTYSHLFWKIVFDSTDPFILSIARFAHKTFPDNEKFRNDMIKLDIRAALKDKSMPTETWLNVIRTYKQKLEDSNKDLQEALPAIKTFITKSFVERINPLLENPKTELELIEILETIRMRIKDPFIENAIGTHNASQNIIHLDQSVIQGYSEKREMSPEGLHLITHEALHAISSGQVVSHKLTFYEDEEKTKTHIHPEWSGLAVSGAEVVRFTWLNEAMTEILSGYVVGIEPLFYKKERQVLELLLVKGKKIIDIDILINAYFEKKGYQADKDTGHVFWNKMRQEIRESYDHDPQFLIRLDILIQEKGIEEAITLLENWDSTNPTKIDITK